jgi:hypothetical protein
MSEPNYVVGDIGFGPAWSDGLYEEMDDAGICTACGHKMTPVRPGKAQCDFCESQEYAKKCEEDSAKWEALAHQLAAALGHSWFAAKVDQRGKLMDFLDKKKAALAAYEEATK